tara:strand:+ start:44 stop:826 length:783 start_codon:yes stop_codon:yes gene_type:complete
MPIDRVDYIHRKQALNLILKYHYSKVMPRLTKYYIGGFEGNKLVGVFTLGWGTRPHHTIAKLFPSLSTPDYFELGKLCVADEMPKNSESQFIAQVISLIKKDMPKIKVLFSWADGIMGKAGYVYQASNFFYGGYIWTRAFLDDRNIRIHERTLQGITPKDKNKNTKFGSVSFETITKLGYKILYGKQFRYVFPTCNKREWKKLLKETNFNWERGNYPKDKDIEFYIKDKKGKRKIEDLKMNTTIYTKKNPMLKNQISLFK